MHRQDDNILRIAINPLEQFDKFVSDLKTISILAKNEKYPLKADKHFLAASLSNKHVSKIIDVVLNDPKKMEQIHDLKNNSSIYFKLKNQDQNKYLRSVSIYKDNNGKYSFRIELKKKLFNNKKHFAELYGGSFKKMKVAVELNVPDEHGKIQINTFASLVSKPQNKDDTDSIKESKQNNDMARKELNNLPSENKSNVEDLFVFNDLFVEKNESIIQHSLYAGENLRTFIDHNPYLVTSDIVSIINQVVSAVGLLQIAKISHRDIKPDNIFVSFSENKDKPIEVKLGDFDFALKYGKAKNFAGTPGYIPTWWRDNRAIVDDKHDLYSLLKTVICVVSNTKIPDEVKKKIVFGMNKKIPKNDSELTKENILNIIRIAISELNNNKQYIDKHVNSLKEKHKEKTLVIDFKKESILKINNNLNAVYDRISFQDMGSINNYKQIMKSLTNDKDRLPQKSINSTILNLLKDNKNTKDNFNLIAKKQVILAL